MHILYLWSEYRKYADNNRPSKWCRRRMTLKTINKLECGPMPNVMAALPNIDGTLCSTPQVGWCPLLQCRAVTLPRRQTRWNLQGCPKLPNRSQPLEGRSSPYYQDTWRRYCCLTRFFLIVDTYLSYEDIARQICAMVSIWRFFVCCIFSEPSAARFTPAS